jgi:benzylsuccinate CoA-transferase BbsF subunit
VGSRALEGIRVADLSGQLAGAGGTRFLAAMGADVIRIEDPVRQGMWDTQRGGHPVRDGTSGIDASGSFNQHNVEKRGVTINLKDDDGRRLFERLVAISDVVCENFAAGVMDRLGYGYERLREVKSNIIYVSNCGFGHTGPYSSFKTWGPVVQAFCGLTFSSGLPEMPSAGIGYSYMDHHGGNFMAIAILAALVHRRRTGEGTWVDMACTEAGAALLGPVVLDATVNGRNLRRPGMPNSNRSSSPLMAPHGIFPAAGEDNWVAIACRDDEDWARLARVVGEPWATGAKWVSLAQRVACEDELDELIRAWTVLHDRFTLSEKLQAAGVPTAAVQRPSERIEQDPDTAAWGLWPQVKHPVIGEVRVDGLPIHLSESDWSIERPAPLLGQHNDEVLGDLLDVNPHELARLRERGAI